MKTHTREATVIVTAPPIGRSLPGTRDTAQTFAFRVFAGQDNRFRQLRGAGLLGRGTQNPQNRSNSIT